MDITAEVIGYLAGIVTNISVFPHAYSVCKMSQNNEVDKINALPISLYIMQDVGCIFWISYGILNQLYPIICSSILNMIPNTYIMFIICYTKCNDTRRVDQNTPVDSIVVTASANNFLSESSLSPDF